MLQSLYGLSMFIMIKWLFMVNHGSEWFIQVMSDLDVSNHDHNDYDGQWFMIIIMVHITKSIIYLAMLYIMINSYIKMIHDGKPMAR